MVVDISFIKHEQEAMLFQIKCLKDYVTKWKVSPSLKEIDQKDLTQLKLTIDYLKEGLENLYKQEDNFILSKLELSIADEIKHKHQEVVASLDKIHRSLIDTNFPILTDKEYIFETIDGLSQIISTLCIQENEILNSSMN